MSLQKSEHNTNGIANGMTGVKRQGTVSLDPLSAAHVYYGESHSKKDRVRTYSSVGSSLQYEASFKSEFYQVEGRAQGQLQHLPFSMTETPFLMG